MTFANPWALLLLLLAPLLILISRQRLIHLSPLRRWVAIGLRLFLFTLLVLALADARLLRQSDDLSVVFLLDRSDSMSVQAKQAALEFVRNALANKPPDDAAGVIAFGANALVEETPQQSLSLFEINSQPNPSYTNFADAIRLGMAIFPPDVPKRLVLLSEGKNNLGDAKSAAQLAAATGIELSTVEIGAAGNPPEVRLQGLDVPSTLHENERFDMALTIGSNLSAGAEVQIFSDGQLIAQEQVNVEPGENRFVFPMIAGEQGFSSFQVRLVPTQDTQLQNNRLDAFSLIEGPLQVLVVAANPVEAGNLVPALEAAGLRPQLAAPHQMPAAPLELSQYAAVILVNVPASAFSPTQLDLLQVYVRDLGHGLVTVGGPESYGAGGYFQTQLEETLPVDMALRDRERLPGMSMFMVIDKSGSMDSSGLQGQGGLRKIELAKEAIYRAIDLLAPWDRVSVIAFDNAARSVVRPVNVVNVQEIKDRVGTLRASGGTDILAGLQAASDKMAAENSRVKHIVLLTDGGANPAGIPELVDELVENEVSLSIVAVGDDYAPFLEDLAAQGNGRFHYVRNASTIPQIFAQEAALASRAYIIEEEFTPKLTAVSPILQGITAMPPLYGYIATSPKLTAQTALVTNQDDPLLAQWQYGLGRSVAWTSDAYGLWAKDWVTWDDFARFWGQVARWTIVEGAGGSLETQVIPDNEKGVLRLTVEALDSRGNYINNLDLNGNLISPELEQTDLALSQVAPGLYEAELRPDETGAYLLRLLGTDETGQLSSSGTRGFVVSYSPEYVADNLAPTHSAEPALSDSRTGSGQALMADLAELGGGQALGPGDAARIFAHTLPPVKGARPLWPLLLLVFALLLPLDVGLRRIIFGREELRKLAGKLHRYLPQPGPKPASVPATSSAGSLLSIKQKDRAASPAAEKSPAAKPTPPDAPTVVINRPVKAEESPAEQPPAEAPDSDDRMSRLLRAKRKARK